MRRCALLNPYFMMLLRTLTTEFSFPLLLERARERRFKKPTMMYKQYKIYRIPDRRIFSDKHIVNLYHSRRLFNYE